MALESSSADRARGLRVDAKPSMGKTPCVGFNCTLMIDGGGVLAAFIRCSRCRLLESSPGPSPSIY